jgi:hypothetical protein
MSMLFKKKSYVRFANMVPGVELIHPIIPASNQKYSWIKELNRDAVQYNSECPVNKQQGNTAKCPGILDVMQRGLIVTAPFDFTITTNGSKTEYEWNMNINPASLNNKINRAYIAHHGRDQLLKYSPTRDDTLDLIIKVNTYWSMFASDDLVFLQMPIPYPDHNMFTACHGIIDSNKYCDLILQLQWHKLTGTHVVKAGTPLCQLIPMKRDMFIDLEVDRMTDDDWYASSAYGYASTHQFSLDGRWKTYSRKILDYFRKK